MVDITGIPVWVMPEPAKVVTFLWPGWFAVMHVLTPEERESLWTEGAVRVNLFGIGPVGFVVAERMA